MWAAAIKLGRLRSDTANVTWAGINAENAVRNAARVGVSDRMGVNRGVNGYKCHMATL